MAELIIRFIGAHDVESRLIQWATNSLLCHTEALSRDGKHWIGAHAFTGVQARRLNWCKDVELDLTYTLPVTDEAYGRGMAWLEGMVGVKYDYTGCFGLAIHKRIGGGVGRVDCSALMTRYMMNSGLWPLNCLDSYAYLITPETLHLSPLFIGRRAASII